MTKYITGAAFFSRGFDTAMTKEDLQSQDEGRQLAALEQIVAYMTIGRDMPGLFNEIAAMTSASNTTIKRLVYLYLQQNSRVQPEKAVLQAGTFVKDTLHDSPLFRGAAVRTMANLQISVMSDFLTAPLRRCLEDSDAYVRRVAALAVLKHYVTASSITFEYGLIEKLTELLTDDNALVCGTAVMALLELHSRDAPGELHAAIAASKEHLLRKLPEGNEWAAHYLLEGIAISYFRLDESKLPAAQFLRECEATMMRVLPYLSSQNIATATAANKVAALFLRRLATYPGVPEVGKVAMERRFAPPVTKAFLSQLEAPRFELRYVALRNTQVFAKFPRMVPYLTAYLGAFLIKHDDPIFVKLEKLDVLVSLADDANGRRVLSELVVYTRDGDAELVAKSIGAMGALATLLPALAPQCVLQLEALINTRVPTIVEHSATVVQNILRCYPGKFLDTIHILCDALTVCSDVDARAAVAWVIGEYPEQVPSPLEYLGAFLDDFTEQPRKVQYAVLTALAKMHVRGVKSTGGGGGDSATVLSTLEKVLGWCTEAAAPDLRDRAFFYWRLLALDIATARRVLSREQQRVPPSLASDAIDRRTQDAFLVGLGALESVAHRPLRAVLGDEAVGGVYAYRGIDAASSSSPSDDDDDNDHHNSDERHQQHRHHHHHGGSGFPSSATVGTGTVSNGTASGPTSPASSRPLNGTAAVTANNTTNKIGTAYQRVLAAEAAGGVEVAMQWSQLGTRLVLNCRLRLEESAPSTNGSGGADYVRHARVVNLQLNRNLHGLGVQQVFPSTTLEPGESPVVVGLIIACNNERQPTRDMQVAMEIEPVGVRYFLAPPVDPAFLLLPATGCEPADFLAWWGAYTRPTWAMPPQLAEMRCDVHRLTANALRVHCINLVHRRDPVSITNTSSPAVTSGFFFFAETIGRHRLLIEMVVAADGVVVRLTVRAEYAPIAAFFAEYVQRCVSAPL